MSWISYLALAFVVWWTVIFAMLPVSLRTQDEDGDVTLGTVPSAPRGSHVRRAMLRTTIVTLVIMAAFIVVTRVWGFDFDDLPAIVPNFE